MGSRDRKGGKVGENFLGSISGHWEKVPQEVGQPGERGGGEDGRRKEKPRVDTVEPAPPPMSENCQMRAAGCNGGYPPPLGTALEVVQVTGQSRAGLGRAVSSHFPKPQEPVLAWPSPAGVVSPGVNQPYPLPLDVAQEGGRCCPLLPAHPSCPG